MLKAGWIEKKEYWIKKGKYGTVLRPKLLENPRKNKKRPSKKEGGIPA